VLKNINNFKKTLLAAFFLCSVGVHAQDRSVWSEWGQDTLDTRWETGAVVAGVTALGIKGWDWGSSKSFRTNPEGWFGERTGSGGADKLGHAFTSYTLTNVLAERLLAQGRSPERAALSAALTTQAVMLYVEVFDGFSNDHGFAREDMVMNLLGSTLAYARQVNPALRDTLDLRLEYQPSGYKGFRPLSDYSGQKYLLAFKLGGIASLRETPLRFLELQAGYYTRGFSKEERADGLARQRVSFVGVGLNLNEIFFGRRNGQEGEWKKAGRLVLEHVQLPYTAVRTRHAF
jgi:hypothetical protein